MRHWLVRGLVVAAAVGTAASAPLARQSARLPVRDAVALYARGDFSAAVRDLDTKGLKVAVFTRALDEWIAAGDVDARQQRGKVAAAFALDADWAATRTIWNHYQRPGDSATRIPPVAPERELLSQSSSQGLVAQWAVQQLPVTGVPDSLERMLWLSAIGLTEDSHGWHRLDRDILPRARKRLADEPRVRLAEVLARTNQDLPLLRREFPSGRDILRKELLGSSATRPIPGAIRAFEPLLADIALTGE